MNLSKLWETIKSWFSTITKEVHDYGVIADNFVNEFKNVEQSAVGQFIETTIETLIPQSTGLINAVKLWLPVAVVDLGWVTKEAGKTEIQLVQDGIAYVSSLKGVKDNIYAMQLSNLATLLTKFLADNAGTALTIQKAIVLPQFIHNPDLLTK